MNFSKSSVALSLGLSLVFVSSWLQAEEGSLKIMMPWDATGSIYHIATDKVLFMGELEGVMYVEKAQGELNLAFASCPGSQQIELPSNATSASGYCTIVISDVDTVYATWECTGKIGVCTGTFNLTGGTGRFQGITGSSELQFRSVLNELVVEMGHGSNIRADSGLAVLPKLTYTIPSSN